MGYTKEVFNSFFPAAGDLSVGIGISCHTSEFHSLLLRARARTLVGSPLVSSASYLRATQARPGPRDHRAGAQPRNLALNSRIYSPNSGKAKGDTQIWGPLIRPRNTSID